MRHVQPEASVRLTQQLIVLEHGRRWCLISASSTPGPDRPARVPRDTAAVGFRTLCGLIRPGWLVPSELRIGLGCMRLSTDEGRDQELAGETIAAAVEAGVTVFDTARAYGHGEAELGHNEQLLAASLRRCGAGDSARIVTKGGMTRAGGAWVPDGRAKAIIGDCEASLVALMAYRSMST